MARQSNDFEDLGNYIEIQVQNENQLSIWTKRLKSDDDFDVTNEEVLSQTIQIKDTSIEEIVKCADSASTVVTHKYKVYIGTDPITEQKLFAYIEVKKSEELLASLPTVMGCVAKACVVRDIVLDENNREMYQLMLSFRRNEKIIEYCVHESEDNIRWFLFIEDFWYFRTNWDVIKLKAEEKENVALLSCNYDNLFEIWCIYALKGNIYRYPINSIIPYSVNGVLKTGIHIRPIGAKGYRKWWCGVVIEPHSGIIELDASNGVNYETRIVNNNIYFAIFLYNKARLMMRDYCDKNEIKCQTTTLLLDGTVIMVEGRIRACFRRLQIPLFDLYPKYNLHTTLATKSEFASISHPILFLRDIPSKYKSQVWEIVVDKFQGHTLHTRSVYLRIAQHNHIELISYLNWNDGHQYIRYYQSTRDWSRNIVIAPNSKPQTPYKDWPKPKCEPIPLWSGVDSHRWELTPEKRKYTRK